jgi:dimethylamine--corrinoid protein Co-methyltransferase
MECTHEVAAGMCGIKTAGDLVMRMQLSKGMRIDAAKKYVAEKLGVSVLDLHDCAVMEDVRERLHLGAQRPLTGQPIGMEVKYWIAKALDIEINCVEKSKRLTGMLPE